MIIAFFQVTAVGYMIVASVLRTMALLAKNIAEDIVEFLTNWDIWKHLVRILSSVVAVTITSVLLTWFARFTVAHIRGDLFFLDTSISEWSDLAKIVAGYIVLTLILLALIFIWIDWDGDEDAKNRVIGGASVGVVCTWGASLFLSIFIKIFSLNIFFTGFTSIGPATAVMNLGMLCLFIFHVGVLIRRG